MSEPLRNEIAGESNWPGNELESGQKSALDGAWEEPPPNEAERAANPPASTPAIFKNPFPVAEITQREDERQGAETPLFDSWLQPAIEPPVRIPHLGHVCLLMVFAAFGLLGGILLTRAALNLHLFGVSTARQASTDIHYALGNMASIYLLTLLACLLFFPLVWHKGLFAGLQWRGSAALGMRYRLFGAALACFLLAMVDEMLLPSPSNAPIDQFFQTSQEAWLLFFFGVTFAPFFEELAFRGFLLPALATAWDWAIEQSTGKPARPLDQDGQPRWSFFAMAGASVATSIPFALMHAEQTAHALGPFLLLVCVSLILCWTRLATRSLAASVLVHSCYNFLLFSLMLLGTGGFRHMEKM